MSLPHARPGSTGSSCPFRPAAANEQHLIGTFSTSWTIRWARVEALLDNEAVLCRLNRALSAVVGMTAHVALLLWRQSGHSGCEVEYDAYCTLSDQKLPETQI